MRMAGAKLNVVTDHDHGHSARSQPPQYLRKALPEPCVKPLGGLVQQQYIWLCEQHLCKRGPLLLAAGQIIRMPLEQAAQAADLRYMRDCFFPAVGRDVFVI